MLQQLVDELQKRLQELKSGGSSDRQIERLEKEIEELHKEKSSSKDELRIRLKQLHKGTQNADKSISEAKDYLNNQQIQCILEELEEQLSDARLEMENKEQRIQELEKELADLKNLSTGDQESLQEEITRLRQFLSDDNYKISDLIAQGKQLAILTERNVILQQRLDQLESRRKEEALIHYEEQERLVKDYESRLQEVQSEYEIIIKQLREERDLLKTQIKLDAKTYKDNVRKLDIEIAKLRNTLILFNRMVDHYYTLLQDTSAPSDVLKDFVEERDGIRETERECYEKHQISSMQNPLDTMLAESMDNICQLESKIEYLEEELKNAKTFKEKNDELTNLNIKITKLRASLQAMIDFLPQEQQGMLQQILNDVK
ncbi:hypothetical protein [Chlamydia crocodili]